MMAVNDEAFDRSMTKDYNLVRQAESMIREPGWNWLMSQVPQTKLTSTQKLLAQQMAESGEAMNDLVRDLADLTAEFDGPPTPRLHRRYVAVTKAFFSAWYETMERSMGYLSAFGGAFGGDRPPYRRVTDFIAWCGRDRAIPDWVVTVFDDARRFRTIVTHAAELPAHNWETFSTGQGAVGVRLFGDGKIPANASANDWEGHPGDWHAISTDPYLAAMAVARTLHATLPRVSGWVLRDDPELGANALPGQPPAT